MKIKAVRIESQVIVGYSFYCPGCKIRHLFYVPEWTFNGNLDKPTFGPSLLNTEPGDDEYRCHLYLVDGVVNYLGDCKHEYAGKNYPLPEITE